MWPTGKWERTGLFPAQQNEARCAASLFSSLTGLNLISSSSDGAVPESQSLRFLGNFENLNKNFCESAVVKQTLELFGATYWSFLVILTPDD